MARTAVIAGTATAVSNNVSRRQASRWGATEEQQAAPATTSGSDPMEDLQQLGQLHDSGVLTDEEFAAKKAEILQRM
ncbi:MAG TPA: SHOCT domain-containing protein [Patescibacteria group bacterium]|nr:SHOCT domain-containing protein [Patescibacteria group bacterium]